MPPPTECLTQKYFYKFDSLTKILDYSLKVSYILCWNSNIIFHRPANGGKYCEGEARRYRLCNNKVQGVLLRNSVTTFCLFGGVNYHSIGKALKSLLF